MKTKEKILSVNSINSIRKLGLYLNYRTHFKKLDFWYHGIIDKELVITALDMVAKQRNISSDLLLNSDKRSQYPSNFISCFSKTIVYSVP